MDGPEYGLVLCSQFPPGNDEDVPEALAAKYRTYRWVTASLRRLTDDVLPALTGVAA